MAIPVGISNMLDDDEYAVCISLVWMARDGPSVDPGNLLQRWQDSVRKFDCSHLEPVLLRDASNNFLKLFKEMKNDALFVDAQTLPDRLAAVVDAAVARLISPVRVALDEGKDDVARVVARVGGEALQKKFDEEHAVVMKWIHAEMQRNGIAQTDAETHVANHDMGDIVTIKLADTWLEYCYAMIESVHAVSDMINTQAFVAATRYGILLSIFVGVCPTLYDVDAALFHTLESKSRLLGVRERANELAATGVQVNMDNDRETRAARGVSLDLLKADNMHRTLSKQKGQYMASLQAQKTLMRIETWVFVCVFVACLMFVLATSRLHHAVNTACIVALSLVMAWMLGMEVLLLSDTIAAAQRKRV